MLHLPQFAQQVANGLGTTVEVDGIEIGTVTQGRELWVHLGPTDSWQDVHRSLKCGRYQLGRGYAHRGYWEGSRLAEDYVLPLVQGCSLRLSGASMGGALAVCLAYRLRHRGVHLVDLTTFAAPAALSEELGPIVASIPGRRYVCGYDLIPRIWPPWGYVHDRPATQLPTVWGPFLGPLLDHRLSSYERVYP